MDYFNNALKIFNNIEFVKTLNITLIEVTENIAICELTVAKQHSNYIGGLHGGVVAGVVDTIAFFPGKLLPSGMRLTTAGFDIRFFRPANIKDNIVGKAKIIYFGRRRSSVGVDVYFKESKKILAQATVDLMVII